TARRSERASGRQEWAASWRRSCSRRLLDRQRLAAGAEAHARALVGALEHKVVEASAAEDRFARQAAQIDRHDVRVDAAAGDAYGALVARHRQPVDPQAVHVPACERFHARRETARLTGSAGLQDLQRLRALVPRRRERLHASLDVSTARVARERLADLRHLRLLILLLLSQRCYLSLHAFDAAR